MHSNGSLWFQIAEIRQKTNLISQFFKTTSYDDVDFFGQRKDAGEEAFLICKLTAHFGFRLLKSAKK